ncbi:hypothetical protein SAMN04487818_107376 [Actinokineospora terrae]|uniref:Uncharacterized protein n=1 Tax=Actinokineospora terrae TaxID=155974 RepID=A0A1H9UNM1_9PSEU|nr:hypothetical protein SAMN04487818_107376 [Actinokineospora terrae]
MFRLSNSASPSTINASPAALARARVSSCARCGGLVLRGAPTPAVAGPQSRGRKAWPCPRTTLRLALPHTKQLHPIEPAWHQRLRGAVQGQRRRGARGWPTLFRAQGWPTSVKAGWRSSSPSPPARIGRFEPTILQRRDLSTTPSTIHRPRPSPIDRSSWSIGSEMGPRAPGGWVPGAELILSWGAAGRLGWGEGSAEGGGFLGVGGGAAVDGLGVAGGFVVGEDGFPPAWARGQVAAGGAEVVGGGHG